MKKYLILAALSATFAFPALAGRVVVNHDEWTMGNGQVNAGLFAGNIANFFSPGGPGSFLVYSTNFGYGTDFQNGITSQGHSVTVNTAATFDLPTLSGYSGVFMGGFLGAYDASVLTSYVNGGGNVYIMAGTAAVGSEDTVWDSFLNNFGFEYGPSYNGIGGTFATTSGHPIFAGVGNLFYNNGNTVLLFGSNPYASILENFQGQGLIGVYDDMQRPIPEPATLGMGGAALLALGLLRLRKRN